MPPVTSTTGTSAGSPSATRAPAVRRRHERRVDGQPARDHPVRRDALGDHSARTASGRHEVALQTGVDPLRVCAEVGEDDAVRQPGRPASPQRGHGAGGRRVNVNDGVRARLLQVRSRPSEPIRSMPAIAGDRGPMRAENSYASPHRLGATRRMPQNIASEVRTKAGGRKLTKWSRTSTWAPSAAKARATASAARAWARAVGRGEDQDAGSSSVTGPPVGHVPKRRSRCW
jgi:hypothetical protein